MLYFLPFEIPLIHSSNGQWNLNLRVMSWIWQKHLCAQGRWEQNDVSFGLVNGRTSLSQVIFKGNGFQFERTLSEQTESHASWTMSTGLQRARTIWNWTDTKEDDVQEWGSGDIARRERRIGNEDSGANVEGGRCSHSSNCFAEFTGVRGNQNRYRRTS